MKNLTNDASLKALEGMSAFYTSSGLFDLLFNKYENQHTPLSLQVLLKDAGLKLLGLDIDRSDMASKHIEQHPDDPNMKDLEKLDVFEQENPEVFENMMHAWCARAF